MQQQVDHIIHASWIIPVEPAGTVIADHGIVIDDGKYAGTWKHGKVGGHMYGKISKIKK